MKKALVVACLLSSQVAFAAEEAYGPFNLDGGHISCKSPSGDEIKKAQVYRAPGDRFFKESSMAVNKIAGWAPRKDGCELQSVKREDISVTTDFGTVSVPVIKEFTAYAYADCGTNVAQFAGKTAAIECSVSATMVKYTNK
jgi:hypothetical protein